MADRMVPVFLRPGKERKVVVFGGGPVAYRKCRQFAGFYITVIADKMVPEMKDVCDEMIRVHFDVADIADYLKGAFICVAATDSKSLNAAIRDEAMKAGIMTNSAHGGGDVLLPSSVRRDGYTVSVSSEGSVPAFPPYVARQIDHFLGPEYDRMLELLKVLRQDLKERVSQQPRRAEFLAEVLASDDIWYSLKNEDSVAAEKEAREIEKRYQDL